MIAEIKELLVKACKLRSVAKAIDTRSAEAEFARVNAVIQLKAIVEYLNWLSKVLSKLEDRQHVEYDVEQDIDTATVADLYELNLVFQAELGTVLMAYKELAEKDRHIEVLFVELKRHSVLATANINQLTKICA